MTQSSFSINFFASLTSVLTPQLGQNVEKDIHVKVDDDWSLRKATIVKERIKVREHSRVKKILSRLSDQLPNQALLQIQPIFGRRGYSIGHYAEVTRADLLVMDAPAKTSVLSRIITQDVEFILSDLPSDLLICRTK